VLGVTSYQEALRALGSRDAADFRLVEEPAHARVQLTVNGTAKSISATELQEIVTTSRARRGAPTSAWPAADVLRSVGLALDELDALQLQLVLCADSLDVAFQTADGRGHELSYAGEELDALRQAAAARRKGYPLRRVLVLHGGADTATSLRELLVAEFAVQSLPTIYAHAVAEAGLLPDAVLADTGADAMPTLEAVRVLRASARTARVPIVVISSPDARLDPADAFQAGADDLLPAPYQPAQLRARLRTWLLRTGHTSSPVLS
jgi:CheY-like chemotaxis protein